MATTSLRVTDQTGAIHEVVVEKGATVTVPLRFTMKVDGVSFEYDKKITIEVI